jgi:cytochrome bd-type quinol oxidase subunit 2
MARSSAGPTRRHPRIVVGVATGFAILGGLLSLGGYFAVAAVEQAYMNAVDVSHWNASSLDAGITVFIVGSVVLLVAVLIVRRNTRARSGARLLWLSAFLLWTATAVNCLGLSLSTDSGSGIGSEIVLLSIVVVVAALVFLVVGIGVLVNRSSRRHSAIAS